MLTVPENSIPLSRSLSSKCDVCGIHSDPLPEWVEPVSHKAGNGLHVCRECLPRLFVFQGPKVPDRSPRALNLKELIEARELWESVDAWFVKRRRPNVP